MKASPCFTTCSARKSPLRDGECMLSSRRYKLQSHAASEVCSRNAALREHAAVCGLETSLPAVHRIMGRATVYPLECNNSLSHLSSLWTYLRPLGNTSKNIVKLAHIGICSSSIMQTAAGSAACCHDPFATEKTMQSETEILQQTELALQSLYSCTARKGADRAQDLLRRKRMVMALRSAGVSFIRHQSGH